MNTVYRRAPGLAALLLSVLLVSCAPPEPTGPAPAETDLPDGAAAASVTLTDLAGAEVRLADYRGKVLLLDFWATWCNPCHVQAKVLDKLYDEIDRETVEFVAVDSGEDRETVEAFVADSPFPYPVWLDPDDRLGLQLGVLVLPTLLILDRDGEVTYFHEGIVDAEVLRRELAKASQAAE